MNKNVLTESFHINDYSNLLLKYSKFGIYTFKIIYMMLKYKQIIIYANTLDSNLNKLILLKINNQEAY